MIIISSIAHNIVVIGGVVVSFGSIFAALKYKIDQASYHKSLFEKRYKIFSSIKKMLLEYTQEGITKTDECITLDLINRGYFLFGKETYEFIALFRKSLITLNSLDNSRASQDQKSQAEIHAAKDFLSSLIDGQNLLDKFKELKIDSY